MVERCISLLEWNTPVQEGSRSTTRDGHIWKRMGWYNRDVRGVPYMGQRHNIPSIQLQRVNGSPQVSAILQATFTREGSASTLRQHCSSCIHKQSQWPKPFNDEYHESNHHSCTSARDSAISKVLSRLPKWAWDRLSC